MHHRTGTKQLNSCTEQVLDACYFNFLFSMLLVHKRRIGLIVSGYHILEQIWLASGVCIVNMCDNLLDESMLHYANGIRGGGLVWCLVGERKEMKYKVQFSPEKDNWQMNYMQRIFLFSESKNRWTNISFPNFQLIIGVCGINWMIKSYKLTYNRNWFLTWYLKFHLIGCHLMFIYFIY